MRHVQETLNVLHEYDSVDNILAILVDSTAVNTVSKNGFVVNLQRILGRNLHLVGCALHQNELPLRALFKKLDGETKHPANFSGPLGKRLNKEPQVLFDVVETPITEEFIPKQVLKDFSDDQRLLSEYCKGIGYGRVNEQWSVKKIGPV